MCAFDVNSSSACSFSMFMFLCSSMETAKLEPLFSLNLLVLRKLMLQFRFQATGPRNLCEFQLTLVCRDLLDGHFLKRRKVSPPDLSLSWNSFHMHTQSERKQILHVQVYGRRSRHFHQKDMILFLLRLLVKFPSASDRVKVECEQNPE